MGLKGVTLTALCAVDHLTAVRSLTKLNADLGIVIQVRGLLEHVDTILSFFQELLTPLLKSGQGEIILINFVGEAEDEDPRRLWVSVRVYDWDSLTALGCGFYQGTGSLSLC